MTGKYLITKIEEACEKDHTFSQMDFGENVKLKDLVTILETAKTNIFIKAEFYGKYDDIEEFIEESINSMHDYNAYEWFEYLIEETDHVNCTADGELYIKVNGDIYKCDITVIMDWCGDWSCRSFTPEGFLIDKVKLIEVEEINNELYIKE